MKSLLPSDYVHNALREAVEAYTHSQEARDIEFRVETKGDRTTFGDFSSTIAFQLSGLLERPPLEIADDIAKKIKTDGYIQKVEVAGNGFLNFFLDQKIYTDAFKDFSLKKIPFTNPPRKQKLIIEYSSPNVAKPLSAGHLRNTILGEFLSRLHAYAGHRVIRWNHMGDWGTQFGKLIVGYKRWGERKKIEANPITELLALYVRFTREAKEDLNLEQEARDEFNKLERGDAVNTKLLDWFLKETVTELKLLYKKLDVHFDVIKGESYYLGGKEKLFALLAKKHLLEESQGAKIIPLTDLHMPPVLLEKSDGATLYHTRDLLSLQYRIKTYHPDAILYVVGSEQKLYLQQLFAAARKIGFDSARLVHVLYGLVFGSGKTKMSTREGNIITAHEVLRDALFRAGAIMHEKHPDPSTLPPADTIEQISIGAVKYNLLKESRESEITFDFEKMLSFNGNSGPYLQYTHARIAHILSKTKVPSRAPDMSRGDETDLSLIGLLLAFSDSLETSKNLLSSHPLTEYLFALANELNAFYEKNPILKDTDTDRRNQRLYMLSVSLDILRKGLYLLGIEAPKRI